MSFYGTCSRNKKCNYSKPHMSYFHLSFPFMYSVCTKVHAYLKISFRLLFGKPKEWFIVIFPLFFFFFYRNLFLYVFSSRFVRSYVRARLIWLGAGCPLCPRQSFLRATAFIYYNWLNYALWAECSFV